MECYVCQTNNDTYYVLLIAYIRVAKRAQKIYSLNVIVIAVRICL